MSLVEAGKAAPARRLGDVGRLEPGQVQGAARELLDQRRGFSHVCGARVRTTHGEAQDGDAGAWRAGRTDVHLASRL